MSSESLHESPELLSENTKNLHRAFVSLIEELEAVDWYQQRAEACSDPELKSVLLHNKNEEIEHACMNLEWLRRNSPEVDERLRTYLFAEGPITQIEAKAKAAAAGGGPAGESSSAEAAPAPVGSLGLGSLRRK